MGKGIRVIILVSCQTCGKKLAQYDKTEQVSLENKDEMGLGLGFYPCPDHRNGHIHMQVLVK